MERSYDICFGRVKEDAVVIETVIGIGNAYDLMTKLASESPGTYFIVCASSNIVCGSIDTSTIPPDLTSSRRWPARPAT